MTFRINQIALIFMALGCQQNIERGVAVEEFEEASDIPQPSQDLDDENDEEESEDDSDDSRDQEQDEDEPDTPEDEEAETVEYDFDSETSLIYVQVFKDTSTIGSGFAHDHVMRADNFLGRVDYNEDDLSACSIAFTLPVTELRVDEAGMRDLVGYGDEISQGDRTEIRGNMLASDQLNANSYSTIDFESTSCAGDAGDEGILIVEGGLTIRGRTANVSIPVRFEINDGQFYAQASFDMNHSEFGMEPYSAFLGSVRNDDPLRFTLDVVGEPN